MLECPNYFDWKFGKNLIKELDQDANVSIIDQTWCWWEFNNKFNYLLPKILDYFEHTTTGNPSKAIYNLVKYCNLDIEYAKKFIENCQIGDPSRIIPEMAHQYNCWNKE